MSYRYECSARYSRDALHDCGAGKPTRKRSKCCGAAYVVTSGLYGVFLHSSVSGSATYRADEALSLHRSESSAERAADASGYSASQLAIRFIAINA